MVNLVTHFVTVCSRVCSRVFANVRKPLPSATCLEVPLEHICEFNGDVSATVINKEHLHLLFVTYLLSIFMIIGCIQPCYFRNLSLWFLVQSQMVP